MDCMKKLINHLGGTQIKLVIHQNLHCFISFFLAKKTCCKMIVYVFMKKSFNKSLLINPCCHNLTTFKAEFLSND